MGYRKRVLTAKCGNCGAAVLWDSTRPLEDSPPKSWPCSQCGAFNRLGKPPAFPKLPPYLYIGHEKTRQMKLYPVPPEETHRSGLFLPYSTRSFVTQAARDLGGCVYHTEYRDTVMGEDVLEDRCMPREIVEDPTYEWSWQDAPDCHLISGWTKGQETCPLWQLIAKLCQTEYERRFLHIYIGLVKDRQFPMLIPQTRVGIAERRRADFTLFAPLQWWQYKWYVVELDASHGPGAAASDEDRDLYFNSEGYEVISVRPGSMGYVEEAKRLVERISLEMTQVEASPWGVALDVPVVGTEEPDIPL